MREALSRLEREGLVRGEHLIGYSAAPQWTRKQFEDLYAFRLLLEPEAARLAALNMTPESLQVLENSAADMGKGEAPIDRNTRYSRFARTDANFFTTRSLKIAGNEVIRTTLFNLHVHLHIFRLMFHSRVTQEALQEHENLLAAVPGESTRMLPIRRCTSTFSVHVIACFRPSNERAAAITRRRGARRAGRRRLAGRRPVQGLRAHYRPVERDARYPGRRSACGHR